MSRGGWRRAVGEKGGGGGLIEKTPSAVKRLIAYKTVKGGVEGWREKRTKKRRSPAAKWGVAFGPMRAAFAEKPVTGCDGETRSREAHKSLLER